jgi:subtilisin family serine protease
MRAIVALALAGVLLAPQVVSLAGGREGTVSETGSAGRPAGWWSTWYRDSDQNGIDDILDAMDPGSAANVFLDYSRRPGPEDQEAAGAFGSGLHDAQHIDTLALYDVPARFFGRLARLPAVVMVEYMPEYHRALDVSVPSLRVRASTTYLDNVWDILGVRGNGTTIAVIDTGVDNRVHESLDDLDDNGSTADPKYVAGYDCSGTVWFTGDPVDNDGHGTHVAGIALGTGGPQHRYQGAAPGARLVDIKVMNAWGTAPAGKVMEGIRWAIEHRAQYNISVMSLSLGTSTSSDGNDAVSQIVNQAVRAGIVAVIAAGNDGPSNTGLGAPAAADEAITVGATDDSGSVGRSDDTLAYYSSRGPRQSDFDLNFSDELKPELSAPGSNIMSALAGTGASYVSMSGTSMACPHVSGVCALVREANGALAPAQVRQILEETAESRGSPYNASLSPKYNTGFGFGIADGYGAVRRALDLRSGGWSGPDSAGSGSSATFRLFMNWTRTEFTTGRDALFFNISIPGSWGRPSSVAASGGSTAFTADILPVASADANWSVRGWLNYTGVPGAPANLTPGLAFDTFAPAVGAETIYTLVGKLEANGIAWNATDREVRVLPGGLVKTDLVILPGDIAFVPTNPSAGDSVRIEVTVRNAGTVGASTEVGIYDGPPGPRTLAGRFGLSVPGSGSASGSFSWTASAGRHTIHAVADPDNLIAETNEANNRANATLVVEGDNQPPNAVLKTSSDSARTGTVLTFDGSGSSDADGTVVYWAFDFGDGASTGWTTQDSAAHAYSSGGDYRVRLTAQDNGAGESWTETTVSITEAGRLALSFYLEQENSLTLVPPGSGGPASAAVPAGTAFADVGTWRAQPLGQPVAAGGDCTVKAYISNTGPSAVGGAVFEFTALRDGTVLNRTATSSYSVPAGGNITVPASFQMPATAFPNGSRMGLQVRAHAGAAGLVLLYGSSSFTSQFGVTLLDPPPLPPAVSAGPDVTARAGEAVRLEGRGADPEGTALLFEWDYDGDGRFDYSGTTGQVDHVYPAAGTFTAVLRARDGAGMYANDSAAVAIRERNRAPQVLGASPTGSVMVAEGSSQLFSIRASDADGDALSYAWHIDGSPVAGASSDSFLFRPSRADVGSRGVRVSVSDGIAQASQSWSVTVERQNRPPAIGSRQPSAEAVDLAEGELVRFSVAATDPDGDRLAYEWLLDGLKVSSGQDFLYSPDHSQAGTHSVGVTATDGRANASASWTVHVRDVNRAPKVSVSSPSDGETFAFGAEIFFECRATDADGDRLEYRWSSDLAGVIGTSSSFSKALPAGVHRLKLVVSDGKAETSVDFTVTVRAKAQPGGKAPGFEAVLSAGALAAAILVVMVRRRYR